jgi:hypothetical protein
MTQPFVPGTTKAQAAAHAVNGTITDFVHASNQGGVIRKQWNVGVLQYGGDGLSSPLSTRRERRVFGPISEWAENPAEIAHLPDAEGQLVPSPLWVTPQAYGNTPMLAALEASENALSSHGGNLVLVVHITDGQPSDGDPRYRVASLAESVKRQGGQLLMTNIHVSRDANPDHALVFPTADQVKDLDYHGRLLFAMSSEVPAELAARLGTQPGARMFAYNAAPSQLAAVLRAGSSVAGTVGGAR